MARISSLIAANAYPGHRPSAAERMIRASTVR
jgi:hypothetical protein